MVGFLGGGVLGGFVVERYKSRVEDRRQHDRRIRDAGDVVTRAVVDYEAAVVHGGSNLQEKLTGLMAEVAPHLPDLPRNLAQLLIEIENSSRWAVVARIDLEDDAPPEVLAQLEQHILDLALLLRDQLLRWRVQHEGKDVATARSEVFERTRAVARLGGFDIVPVEGKPFGPQS
ncbi:hypothetical protein ACIBO1_30805 [Micromonospora sp. NPDC049903]|uniref:hypothetical protein n=1 Tax=Micromonospora sp. NPDC049903 TaxID=3364276 RepID=UPI00379D4460